MENTNKKSLISFMSGFKVFVGAVISLVLLVSAAWINDAFKDPTFLCLKGNDKCLMDAVLRERDDRASGEKAILAQAKAFVEAKNVKIESYKSRFSLPFVQDELKAGRRENVPSSLLQQLVNLVAPQAQAKDNGMADISWSEPAYAPVHIENGLNAYLESKNSPFAHVNLMEVGERNGLTADQMYLLVGISGKESNFGTVYRRKSGSGLIRDDALGLTYHNPVGIKWCLRLPDCPPSGTMPDENGFWLQKYDSWEQFWDLYTRQMKSAYFEGQCDTTSCMKQKYVGGSKENKNEWEREINNFLYDMKDFGQKYYAKQIEQHNSYSI